MHRFRRLANRTRFLVFQRHRAGHAVAARRARFLALLDAEAPVRAQVRRPGGLRAGRGLSGPEVSEAEGDRVEGGDADRIVVLRARDRHPLPVAQLERP